MSRYRRRQFLARLGAAGAAWPLLAPLRTLYADSPTHAKRLIIFYFPDGVPGESDNGQPSLWHPTGGTTSFALPDVLTPLAPHKSDCVFLNGLTMGPADQGSHPGGARKLLTGVDGGGGISIDRWLAGQIGSASPHSMIYLGAQATANNPSGDKYISYVAPGVTVSPEDNPLAAFSSLLSGGVSAPTPNNPTPSGPNPQDVSVIDGVLADVNALRAQLGTTEKARLDLHLSAVREVEKRIKAVASTPPDAPSPSSDCDSPTLETSVSPSQLFAPESFPAILRAQIDVTVQSMACGLTQVGVIQGSQHTSELIMSRFEGTDMYDPGFDMRSHQASHYGPSHDFGKLEFSAFVQQRKWWVEQFAYLLSELKARPDGEQTMLDTSIVLLCTEVCDGNKHLHDNMPFVLAGGAGGLLSGGRLLEYWGTRHSNLLLSLAHAMGQSLGAFGQASSGGLTGLLSA